MAEVTQLLKKVGFDTSDPSNHRSISNLSTISKALERLLLTHLIPRISANLCRLHSAYCRYDSTKTTLLRIFNDLFEAADAKEITVLATSDLSAVFDTIDHSVLLQRLHHIFGIGGPAIRWIRSYLHKRPSFIKTVVAHHLRLLATPGVRKTRHSDNFSSRCL